MMVLIADRSTEGDHPTIKAAPRGSLGRQGESIADDGCDDVRCMHEAPCPSIAERENLGQRLI
jgi:hypothetical protein